MAASRDLRATGVKPLEPLPDEVWTGPLTPPARWAPAVTSEEQPTRRARQIGRQRRIVPQANPSLLGNGIITTCRLPFVGMSFVCASSAICVLLRNSALRSGPFRRALVPPSGVGGQVRSLNGYAYLPSLRGSVRAKLRVQLIHNSELPVCFF